jgi:hypothetical protein
MGTEHDHRSNVRRLLLAVALLGLSLNAAASTYPNGTRANGQSVWNQAMNGRTTTVNGQGSGTGTAAKNVTGNADVLDTAGNVIVSGGATVGVNGSSVAVQATGKINKGDVANAAVAAAGCAVGGGGAVGAVVCGGVALAIPLAMNWMANAGVRINPTTKELEKSNQSDLGYCFTGTCYWWSESHNPGQTYRTQEAACNAYASWYRATFPGRQSNWSAGPTITSCTGSNVLANGTIDLQGNVNVGIARNGTRAADPIAWSSSSIADATGLMNNSRLPTANIVGELEAAGQTAAMPIKDVAVTGPASVQGPSTTAVTNNSTTNTTTTNSTTTNNYTYNTNNVTNSSSVTTTTSSTAVKNADGSTTTTTGPTTTTTTNPGTADPVKPEDPPTQCDKFPNSLGCAELDTPSAEIPRETKNVTFQAEDLFGGGQCPADVMTTLSTLDGRSVKVIDWQTFCGYALPLRALVMGLAAIMAFFIIMPGGVRE